MKKTFIGTTMLVLLATLAACGTTTTNPTTTPTTGEPTTTVAPTTPAATPTTTAKPTTTAAPTTVKPTTTAAPTTAAPTTTVTPTTETPTTNAPVAEAKSIDFDTIVTAKDFGDSGYAGTYTTTSGWEVKNCAIQTGGPAGCSNPQFAVVGPDKTHKAACLNGKTSAPGTLTSPTLNGGLTKINVDYTKVFSDTSLSATITVTEVSSGTVYTHTFGKPTLDSKEKEVVYSDTWELETAVTGDFTITVTNDCPSAQDKNKDRMTILKFEWL